MAKRSIVIAAVLVLASTITAGARTSIPISIPMTGVNGKSVVLPALMNAAYGGYTTAIYIENVSHTGVPANVSITYYSQSGTVSGSGDTNMAIPFWAEWTVRQDNGNSFASGQAGWGVIASDQEIAVFVNEFAPNASADGSSYTSIQMPAGGGTTLYAPVILNNAYGGYTTGIGLANTGGMATTATVNYRDATGTSAKTQIVMLPAHGYAGLFSGDAMLALPGGFIGTATIASSGQVLAAIVNEIGPGGQFSSYDAVSSGSTTMFVPAALHGAYGGYNTGMGIQNTTGTDGTVTINYYDGSGTAAGTVSKPIVGNGYLGIYQGGADGPPMSASGYTAQITGTVAMAAIVNEVSPTGAQSTSFNADTAGSGYLNLPLVENMGSDGFSTGLAIMNVTNATINFTLTYFSAATGSGLTSFMLSLGAHAYMGRYTPSDLTTPGTRATAWLSSTTGLVAIANEAGSGTLMSYNGQ